MVPLRIYQNYKGTPGKHRSFRKKYFFVCEGKNTEYQYLIKLSNNRKEAGINDSIQLVPLEKIGIDESSSHPKNLIELADNWKKEKTSSSTKEEFDSKIDKIVLVFDLDVIKKISDYRDLITAIESKGYLLAVTNPCFELWLILHEKNSFNKIIKPNEAEFLKNKRRNNKYTYVSKKCKDIFGFNPKKEIYFTCFTQKLKCAIEQEKLLEQNPKEMFGKIGSNIGSLISTLLTE